MVFQLLGHSQSLWSSDHRYAYSKLVYSLMHLLAWLLVFVTSQHFTVFSGFNPDSLSKDTISHQLGEGCNFYLLKFTYYIF